MRRVPDSVKAENWSGHLDDLVEERDFAERSARRWKRIARLFLRKHRAALAAEVTKSETYQEAMRMMFDELAERASCCHTIVVEEEEAPYVTKGEN